MGLRDRRVANPGISSLRVATLRKEGEDGVEQVMNLHPEDVKLIRRDKVNVTDVGIVGKYGDTQVNIAIRDKFESRCIIHIKIHSGNLIEI